MSGRSSTHELADALRGVSELSWRADAACRGMELSLFAVESGSYTDRARETCFRCPVRYECGEDALATSTQATLRAGFGMSSQRARRRLAQWLASELKSRDDRADTSVAS